MLMAAQQRCAFNRVFRMSIRLMLIVWSIVALGGTAQAQIPAVDLGNLGGREISAADISETGVVVGGATTASGQTRAFMWSADTGIVELGTLGGESYAIGVNDAGVVIGHSRTPDFHPHAFIWTSATGMQSLTPPGMESSEAVAINNSGEVALMATESAFGRRKRVFRWSPSAGYIEMPGDHFDVRVWDMNSAGIIVGYYTPAEGTLRRPFMWSPETGTTDLEGPEGMDVEALRITDSSGVLLQAVENDPPSGEPGCDPFRHRAFFWSGSTGLVDMGYRWGDTNTVMTDINRDGVAVGMSFRTDPFDEQASECLYSQITWSIEAGVQETGYSYRPLAINDDGYMISFNPYGGDGILRTPDGQVISLEGSLWALSLNNQGQIAGQGLDDQGNLRLLMWRYSPAVAPNTATGVNVSVTASVTLPDGTSQDVSVTFGEVTTAGETTVTASTDAPPPPAGFKLTNPPLYYDIDTTAIFSGAARVCVGWSEGQVADEATVSLFHHDGNQWVDITDPASRDTLNNRICGFTSSFSPFALFEPEKFPFVGFFDPIGNGSVVNAAKAGSAIPVKFSLGGDRGLGIFAAGFPRSVRTPCDTGAPIDVVEETAAAGASPLTYDPALDRYTYVWKTEKAWASSCRELQVKFTDGSVYTARFSFLK